MLPLIDEELYPEVVEDIVADVAAWRKKMIHYIKEENPELNSAIIEIANKTQLDPKAVATGAYMAYLLLEKAGGGGEDGPDLDELLG
jgi:hypothetical protein